MGSTTWGVVLGAVILLIALWSFSGSPPRPEMPSEGWWGPGAPKEEDESIRPFKVRTDSLLL